MTEKEQTDTGGAVSAQHTPGPWSFNGPSIFGPYGERHDIAHVSGYMDDDGEANARLIAAAPALLEALEGCIKALTHEAVGTWDDSPEMYQGFHDAVRVARAAVAAAREGE